MTPDAARKAAEYQRKKRLTDPGDVARQQEAMRKYRRDHPERIAAATEARKEKFKEYHKTITGKAALIAGRMNVRSSGRGKVASRDIIPLLQQGKCTNCGSKENLEIDHILALRDGGKNSGRNLAVLCKACHKEKTAAERARRSRGASFPSWICNLTGIQQHQLTLF